MDAASKKLIETVLRHAKGIIKAVEVWLKEKAEAATNNTSRLD